MTRDDAGPRRPSGGVAAPRVSIVLPAFNAERHVGEAVSSLLGQSLRAFEIVAIDDGSTDGTARVLADLAAQDDRLRLLRRHHRGLTPALNEGLAVATAPLVAIMNADDVATPERLQRQADFLDRHPGIAAVGGQTRSFLDGGGQLGPATALPTDPPSVRACLAEAAPLAHPAVMMRREAVLAAGGYRPTLEPAEDYDLWLRLAERHELANLPDVVLLYRLHAGQATAAAFERVALATLVAREAARRRAAGRPDPVEAASAGGSTLEDLAAECGVVPAAIASAAIHAALGRGESLLSVDAAPTAARAALTALADSRSAAALPAGYRAARNWLEGRILVAGGRYAAAVPRFVEAAVAEPAFRARLAGAVGRRVNAVVALPRRPEG